MQVQITIDDATLAKLEAIASRLEVSVEELVSRWMRDDVARLNTEDK